VVGAVVLCGIASTLAAYGLSKLRLPWWLTATVGASCAVVPMLPPMALVPGLYVTLIQTGLLGSLTGLIILNTILNLPFATLLMKIGFDEIPPALQEAASIDGASEARSFWTILLPLVTPSLVTSSLFTAIMTWNEFLMGLTMTSGGTTSPLSVGIASLVQPFEVRWGQLSAVAPRLRRCASIAVHSGRVLQVDGLSDCNDRRSHRSPPGSCCRRTLFFRDRR
jgi:multiple sugar transport system permease protein